MATPIQHVIVIMQENHSFDNYFGTYPSANGTLLNSITSQLQRVNGIPDGVCLPYMGTCIAPRLSTSPDPPNPEEGQQTYEMDYANNGTGFPSNSGPQSMVYFDYHSVAAYWDYAEQYGIADNYFAPVLGTTTPNRLILLTGNSSVSANYGPPPYMPYTGTVMHQLDEAGVSWGYYDYIGTYGGASNTYPLNYFSNRTSQAIDNTLPVPILSQQLAQGAGLPSVSFVNSLGNPQLDEHPSSNPTRGELWVESLINQVMESTYWSTTAIFVTWDEGGGYYDHVDPPGAFAINNSFTDPLLGLGQRVPLLVISPYAKQSFVSHDLLSHLSLLHFIEYNWNQTPLNTLVEKANLPLSFFNFSQQPRAPIILSSSPTYPIPLQNQSDNPLPYVAIFSTIFAGSTLAVLTAFLVKRKKNSISQPAKVPPTHAT